MSFSYLAIIKHTRNSMQIVSLKKCSKIPFTDCIDVLFRIIRNKYFMTVSIFAFKGKLIRKILLLRFFSHFFVGYNVSDNRSQWPTETTDIERIQLKF